MEPSLRLVEADFETKENEKDAGQYVIESLSPESVQDQLQTREWRKKALRLVPVLSLIPQLLALKYVWIQLHTFWALPKDGSVPGSIPRPLLLALPLNNLLACAMGLVGAFAYVPAVFQSSRPRYRLLGQEAPQIDVIITICNEALDIVQDTVLATTALDYPQDRLRIIVSDDGASSSLKLWITELKTVHPNLWYTARAKEDRAGYKAGNLNHALRFIQSLPGAPAKFLAGLDADMIPEKHWLRHVIPHLLIDVSVGSACPAQLFYNFPQDDPLVQSQQADFKALQILRDHTGNGWNNGSGWICRRTAISQIGGFPTASLTEDTYATFLMLSEGYKTVYLAEALQYGLMPDTLNGHVKQFTRWHMGGCQIGLEMGLFVRSRFTKRMSLAQRMQAFCWTMDGLLVPLATFSTFVITPIWMFSTVPLEPLADKSNLNQLLQLSCAAVLVNWMIELCKSLATGYQTAVRVKSMHIWLQPHHTIAMIRYWLLPDWLGGRRTSFTPSGSISKVIQERDPELRPGLSQRIKVILIQSGAWPNIVVVVMLFLGALVRLHRLWSNHPGGIPTESLLLYVLWPPLPWFQLAIACLTPIQYALWPPNVMERRKLTVGHVPTTRAMEQRIAGIGWRYPLLYTLSVLYTGVILIWTFYR